MTLKETEVRPEEQTKGLSECAHLKDSFRKSKIIECMKKGNFSLDKCDECKPGDRFVAMDSEYSYDVSFWLCMFCGKNLCGRNMNRHAIQHYENERSPNDTLHTVWLNVEQNCVWCYSCDSYVDISNQKDIKSILTSLKTNGNKPFNEPSSSSFVLNQNIHTFTNFSTPKPVRGLVNLGNTCYMNSVLQCLSKTPYLLKVLKELKENKFEFRLNSQSNFDQRNVNGGTIQSINDTVTLQFYETIRELNNSSAGCYDPSSLLRSIAQIVHQFSGYQQHDSHELMRHLLEIVRKCEFNRSKEAIKKCLSPEDRNDNKLLKGLAQELTSQLITTETVFKGFLVSTLQCEQCRHKSKREECFLDLSLPIFTYYSNKMDDDHYNYNFGYNMAPQQSHYSNQNYYYSHNNNQPSSNGSCENTSKKMTRKQLKKAEKRKNRENRKNRKKGQTATLSASYPSIDMSKTNIKIVPDTKVDKKLCVDGDVSSATHIDGDEENEMAPEEAVMDDNEAINGLNDDANTNDDDGDGDGDGDGDDEDDDEEEKSSSTSADQCMEVNNSTDDLNSVIDKQIDSFCTSDDKMDVDSQYDTQRKCSISFENEQCSVTTCLFRFTQTEMMGGNNKVGCERCTQNNGKLIYQKSKKQLLISQPPPVLILHLKRFEAYMGSYRKIVKAVNFSTTLDLTPFCWKDCRTPSISNQYLYSLYGVVEHSGSLRSGHYVAYVKVRQFHENKDFIQAQINQSKSAENLIVKLLTANVIFSSATNDSAANSNNTFWFRISDSSYSPVSEKQVLSAQAYLLFYERIA